MKNLRMKLGMILMILAIGVASTACGEKENEPVMHREPSKEASEDKPVEKKEKEYIIQELNLVEETLTAISADEGKPVRYSFNLGTKFLDKYGNSYSSIHFTPGQVITLGEVNDRSILTSVKMSDDVWSSEEVENYSIDTNRGVFSIGEMNYRITSKSMVFSGDAQLAMDAIGEGNKLQVIGKDKDILSVVVTTGTGTITLVNTGVFQDSLVCIGNRIITRITGDMSIPVPEGTYSITVANKGYGGSKEYTVSRGQETMVDLNELKGSGPKMCRLTLDSDVAGVIVTLDGQQITVGEEMQVTYGIHKLSVEAEGYDTWSKTLVVNSESATIELDMEETESKETNTNTTVTPPTNNNSTNSSASDKTDTDSSSKKDDITQKDVDYLTTLSNMLGKLLD